ncbi:MAG: RNA-binding S4 domain-containing protein [Gammaproteobacteria bacterium]
MTGDASTSKTAHQALLAEGSSLRLDKWLWAARFFKTRGLATEAISGGHVHLNGARSKPARGVKAGDRIRIRKGDLEWLVTVVGLSAQRRPAQEARHLYTEDESSIESRQRHQEMKRLAQASTPSSEGRPDKRDRRRIRQFRGH